MSELPSVTRAACGHWVAADSPSNALAPGGSGEPQPVVLCSACLPARPVPLLNTVEFKVMGADMGDAIRAGVAKALAGDVPNRDRGLKAPPVTVEKRKPGRPRKVR